MRHFLRGSSNWIVAHPVWWAVASGAAVVLVGWATGLAPAVIAAIAAVIAVLNVLHARRRGYCPIPPQSDVQWDEVTDR